MNTYWNRYFSTHSGMGARQETINRHMRRVRNRSGGGNGGGGGYTQAMNDNAAAAILMTAQPMLQPMFTFPLAGNNVVQGNTYAQNLNNIGLNTDIFLEISGLITAGAAENLAKTPWGIFNLLSNVQLTDLSNFQRVNTYGWHLHMLATARGRGAFGGAFLNDSPASFGSNFLTQNAPANVANTAALPFRIFYHIPLAYSPRDLRGAIWANVTSAQWRLQFTFNNNFFANANVADTTLSCYKSNLTPNLATLSNIQVTIYQRYFDQIPQGQNGAVVPLISLAYNYLLNGTPSNVQFTQGQDNPLQYINFRTILSTAAIFDNGGQLNFGTDINYWAIQAANLVYLQRMDPFMVQLLTREIIGDDCPGGSYYFDHRKKPIMTNQYGNMSLVLNPSLVNAGAVLYLGYEMLALQNQAINSGSLQ